jgi:hypothetical protein
MVISTLMKLVKRVLRVGWGGISSQRGPMPCKILTREPVWQHRGRGRTYIHTDIHNGFPHKDFFTASAPLGADAQKGL